MQFEVGAETGRACSGGPSVASEQHGTPPVLGKMGPTRDGGSYPVLLLWAQLRQPSLCVPPATAPCSGLSGVPPNTVGIQPPGPQNVTVAGRGLYSSD